MLSDGGWNTLYNMRYPNTIEGALYFGKQYRTKRMIMFLEHFIIFDITNLLPMDEKHMEHNILVYINIHNILI